MGKEEWKSIKGFECYEISNTGLVRSKDREITTGVATFIKKGQILIPVDNGKGYKKVVLKSNGKVKRAYIHRLVAQYFIPNPENKPFINHIDNDPSNNSADNLGWCTHQENMDWAKSQGRTKWNKEACDKLHKTMEKTYVAVIGENIKTGEKLYFEKLNDVKKAGFQPSCVCYCCKGKRGIRQHKGYRWEYGQHNSKKQEMLCV